MAKNKDLTAEELIAKKVRNSNGWVRFWAILLALVLVGGVAAGGKSMADKENQKADEAASQYEEAMKNLQGSGAGAQSWDDGAAQGDAAAPADSKAEDAAKAINDATAAAENVAYNWIRKCNFTKDVSVGSATEILNKVIHGVDSNASINSVVGGFIGVGEKEAKIEAGKAKDSIGYHGESYKLKATQLKGADLQDLVVDGDTYTFKLADANTPKKDGSTPLSRLTDDIVIQEEVASEIDALVGGAVKVQSLVGVYSNINVKAVITDGKLVEFTYSYDADVSELGLKVAVVSVKGTGAMHTEANFTNFVY